MPKVIVSAECKPTESVAKVKMAILNLFPDLDFVEENDLLRGETGSLERFGELLRNQKIRDAAREVLEGSIRGNRMVFHLNKQAAYAGKVSFASRSPLGDITVSVEDEDLQALIDEIAPSTFRKQ